MPYICSENALSCVEGKAQDQFEWAQKSDPILFSWQQLEFSDSEMLVYVSKHLVHLTSLLGFLKGSHK